MTTSAPWRTTTGPVGEHPWVLITGDNDGMIGEMRAECSRRGWETYVCDGPCTGHSCPLSGDGTCPVVEGAHLVVNALDPDDLRVAGLLKVLADRYPDLPVLAPEDLTG